MGSVIHGLIAFDGTESIEHARNVLPGRTHVRRFHDDFRGPDKWYLDGPELSGSNTKHIAQVGREIAKIFFRKIRRGGSASDLRLSLIGWSRGAMIATTVAHWLAKEGLSVEYMGLLDAVDMDWTGGMAGISVEPFTNVRTVLHAKRHSFVGSRSYSMAVEHTPTYRHDGARVKPVTLDWNHRNDFNFKVTGGNYYQRYFLTTHGGMGGALGQTTPQGLTDDYSAHRSLFRLQTARSHEQEVYEWMRAGARKAGLPI